MSELDRTAEKTAAGVRSYEFLSIASLLILVLALLQRGHTTWAIIPLLVGLLGVYARMGLAPVMVLLTLVPQLIEQWSSREVWPAELDVGEWLECVGMLGYASGHYRLQGLTLALLPADPRRRKSDPPAPGQGPARREVPPRELAALMIGLLILSFAAYPLWLVLPDDWHELGLLPRGWRMLALGWLVGVSVLLGAGFFNYIARADMSRAEAALFLQDVLWRETRGEQRRLSRWLAWARLRYRRRIEPSDR